MPEPAIDLEEFKADYMNTQYRICATLEEMQAAEAEFDRAIAKIKADAVREAVEAQRRALRNARRQSPAHVASVNYVLAQLLAEASGIEAKP